MKNILLFFSVLVLMVLVLSPRTAHAQVFFQEDFETCDFTSIFFPTKSPGWTFKKGGISINTSAADAHTGSCSSRHFRKAGSVIAQLHANFPTGGFPFKEIKEFYIRLYKKYAPNGDPTFEKTLYIKSEHIWNAGIGGDEKIKLWIANPSVGVQTIRQTFPPYVMEEGIWYYIELYFKVNDPGMNNGIMKLWIARDGETSTLKIDRSDLNINNGGSPQGVSRVELDSEWGRSGTRDTTTFYDDIVMSTKRIGPLPSEGVDRIPPAPPQNLRIQ